MTSDKGLYPKFEIRKTDGTPIDPEADYFVLRLDDDPAARKAALEYCMLTDNIKLANELRDKLHQYRMRELENAPGEPQTCPRRMQEMGPWEYTENLDRWEKRGPDRVCSFCGSMHPDDFEKVLDRALVDDTVRIEQSTKSYKVYLHRPEIGNAGNGAIKFYKQHVPDDPDHVKRVGPKFAKAAGLSRDRLRKYMDKANKVITRDQGEDND